MKNKFFGEGKMIKKNPVLIEEKINALKLTSMDESLRYHYILMFRQR